MKTIFHIGLHKTATTWFQQIYFSGHPELCLINNWDKPWEDRFLKYLIMTPIKKFDVQIAKSLLRKQIEEKRGAESDKRPVISAERLSGHPYSGGHDRYEIMNRIKQVAPDARILIFYRDQIPMLKSLYKQMVWEGYTGKIQHLICGKNWKGKSFDLSYLEYDLLAEAYIKKFGRENVLICNFNDFLIHKELVLSKICDFFEVPKYIDDESLETKLAKRSEDKTIPARRLLNKFRKTEYVDSPIFLLPPNLTNLICRLIPPLNSDIHISDKDRECLKKYFEPSNSRLMQLIEG